MPKHPPKRDPQTAPPPRPGLKLLAEHLNLSPSTISFVLNNTPNRSIPEATRERVRAAALHFNYRPSLIARKLQGQRSQTIGILLPVLGEAYHSQVLSGAGDLLLREGFFYFTVHHSHGPDLVRAYPELLHARGVEGLLAIDTHLEAPTGLPTVLVAGHTPLPDVANVILNSDLGARLALGHLHALGHREIVFMRGQTISADTADRWNATLAVAHSLNLPVRDSLILRLDQDTHSPDIAHAGIHRILAARTPFTAVLCFNDVAAIGVIRALHETGRRVPHDVSVLGYDDIDSAAFHVPSITTIRQPLQHMGAAAATLLLRKLTGELTDPILRVDPTFILRESTGPAHPIS